MASYKSTLFSPCPWQLMDALPTNIKANAIAIYLVIHRRGFMEASGQATVPINEISAEAGVGQKATRTALRWLVTEGWVTRIDQIGGASFYRVWTDEPKRTPRKSAKGSTPGKSAKGTPRKAAIPPPQDCQGTPRNFARDIYIQELEELEKKNSPIPVSLSSPAESPKSEPNSPQPAAARVRGRDPEQSAKRKAKEPADPYGSKRLPEGAVPEDLMHLQQLLTDWWGVKPKGRTRKGFEQACRVLRKQPPEVQEEMLSKAIMGAYQGLHAPERRGSSSPSPTREQRREFMRRADQELKGRNIFELYAEQQAAKASAAAIVPVNVAAIS